MDIEWIGFIGTALVALAYMPQIIHLTKEGCTAGISLGAYFTWFSASFLLLIYALIQQDAVFIVLQSYQLLATTLILFFSYRHKGQNCDQHGGACAVHDKH